ncbi:M43 family zinc metalloprotease [Flavobacteriales bacterium]|nr:M43 family zinc metalloprotease [Flavobacteriales bacterium]
MISLAATAQRNCGSMDVLELQLEEDPKRAFMMDQIETHLLNIENTGVREVNGVVNIPVVVHVIYNNSTENISDAQVLSQINVLNEDFRRTNPDADDTWSQATDSEIEFCMATSDPLGNATSGIVRTSTSVSAFGTNDQMKFASSGGADAWPASDYLNIWVCDISGGILGYAQFPGGSATTDGIVIDYQYFGTIGTASAPFDLGRTATHEVGHWLNLRHIWGDGGCNVDDFVSDTPASNSANYGCALGNSACGSVDMVQNYMDYSDDACMNLFTLGQRNRMRALFESGGYRSSLLNSSACGDVVAPTCDDGLQNGDEEGIDCGGSNCEPCICEGVEVTMTLNFDNYPSETSWQITGGGTVFASGGTYGSQPQMSTLNITECLPEGCYTVTVFDSYGDGLCCSYGEGSYFVTDEYGNELASGASFSSSSSGNFCVTIDNGPNPTCDDGIQNGDETGIDCGGSCAACATCDDGIQNGDETGIDCGGSCAACATCDDGILNGDETGIDCGGSCAACATCDDGILNGDETGVDCGGPDCEPCQTGPCSYGDIDVENFESGWGIWNSGGSDCRRNRRDRNFANGTYCVRLRDNSSTSVTYTDDLDLSGYEELTVGFGFIANSMENGEDFVLEYSTNGGNQFTTVATYIRGVNFSNGPSYSDEVVIPGPFSSSTVIQFRCDASANNDKIYLDDIAISGCTSGGRWSAPVTPLTEADLLATPSPFGMLNLYPNPASDAIQLDFVLYEDTQFEWMITDMQGRVLTNALGEGLRGEQQLHIEVSGWPEGTYLLFLRSTNGAHTKRFMIQR